MGTGFPRTPGAAVTLQEYMSPAVFPLTTQPGLAPEDQMFIDAVNHDELNEIADLGRPLSAYQRAMLAEYNAKLAARPALQQQLAAARPAPQPQPGGRP